MTVRELQEELEHFADDAKVEIHDRQGFYRDVKRVGAIPADPKRDAPQVASLESGERV